MKQAARSQPLPSDFRRPASAPRRFSIATLFMVTSTCGVLFAVLKARQASAATFTFTLTFFATIAVAQMALGRVPRLASVAVGTVLLPLSVVLGGTMAPDGLRSPEHAVIVAAATFVLYALPGALLGYFGGVLVAGLFLVQDILASVLRGWREKH